MKFFQKWGLIPLAVIIPALVLFFATKVTDQLGDSQGLNTKVMVVNNDQSIQSDAGKVEAGNQLVEKLKTDKQLDWTFVDEKTADEALKKHTALVSLTIPSDFSKATASLLSDKPQKANLNIKLASNNTPLSSLLFGTVGNTLKAQVTQTVQQNYGTQLLSGLSQLVDGTKQAADGSGQLNSGAAQLNAGQAQINAGVTELVDKLKASGNQIASQQDAAAADLKKLDGYLNQLGSTLSQFNAVTDIGTNIQAGGAQLKSGLEGTAASATEMKGILSSPVVQAAIFAANPAGALRLQAIAGAGAQTLADNVTALTDNLKKIGTDGPQVTLNAKKAIATLNSGLTEVRNSLTGANAAQLDTLKDGENQLSSGLTQLNAGTNELSTKLSDGVKQLPTINNQAASAEQLASPVSVSTKSLAANMTYKNFFSPASIMLGLFLGSVLLQIHGLFSRGRKFISSDLANGLLILPGIATLLVAIVAAITGVHVNNWIGFILATLFSSAVLTAIIGFISRLLGRLGLMISIVLVFIQFIFATALVPDQLLGGAKALSKVLPGNYVTSLLSNMINGNGTISTATSVIVLLIMGLISFGGSYLLTQRTLSNKKSAAA